MSLIITDYSIVFAAKPKEGEAKPDSLAFIDTTDFGLLSSKLIFSGLEVGEFIPTEESVSRKGNFPATGEIFFDPINGQLKFTNGVTLVKEPFKFSIIEVFDNGYIEHKIDQIAIRIAEKVINKKADFLAAGINYDYFIKHENPDEIFIERVLKPLKDLYSSSLSAGALIFSENIDDHAKLQTTLVVGKLNKTGEKGFIIKHNFAVQSENLNHHISFIKNIQTYRDKSDAELKRLEKFLNV